MKGMKRIKNRSQKMMKKMQKSNICCLVKRKKKEIEKMWKVKCYKNGIGKRITKVRAKMHWKGKPHQVAGKYAKKLQMDEATKNLHAKWPVYAKEE